MVNWTNILESIFYYDLVFPRNKDIKPVPCRNVIDVGRERWKDGGGRDTNVMFVSGDVGGQGHRHQDADPRPGPGAVPSLLSAQEARSGGESVLQQVRGQDPEAAQVSELHSDKRVLRKIRIFVRKYAVFKIYQLFDLFNYCSDIQNEFNKNSDELMMCSGCI